LRSWGRELDKILAAASSPLAIRALFLLDVRWRMPIWPRKIPSTHQKRRSQRLDQVVPWPIKLIVSSVVIAFDYLCDTLPRPFSL
jgi:hypothetical protein